FGLHECSWRADSGAELELEFALRPDPASGDGEPVDLGGGVTGRRAARSDVFPACAVSWLHRPGADPGGVGEVVAIEVRDVGRTGLDACGLAVGAATGLRPELPTG
ncbi:MAG TPA: hypothetical protein VGD43_06080, partial [Micromonospora sp.]